jgi:hypothetical protein
LPCLCNRVAALEGYIGEVNLIRTFTEHPASVGESYTEHLLRAMYFGTRMMFAGIACLVHGVLPFLFVRTGSRAITELNDRMVVNRGGEVPAISGDKRLPL